MIMIKLVIYTLILSIYPVLNDARLVSNINDQDLTTFILVRHAEKVDDSSDPDLSSQGYERAARLHDMFDHTAFNTVYSTPLIRTLETARAIAVSNSVEIIEYDHRNPEEVVSRWIREHKGETVLVSGHSNSTPMFANALLGREHFSTKFDESDYSNLLIITIDGQGNSKLIHLRY
jgi:2,3-bisphosphoglycerate-dependent phosphoglycerate mutase